MPRTILAGSDGTAPRLRPVTAARTKTPATAARVAQRCIERVAGCTKRVVACTSPSWSLAVIRRGRPGGDLSAAPLPARVCGRSGVALRLGRARVAEDPEQRRVPGAEIPP